LRNIQNFQICCHFGFLPFVFNQALTTNPLEIVVTTATGEAMTLLNFDPLTIELGHLKPITDVGRVAGTESGILLVKGLSRLCGLGDRVTIHTKSGAEIDGEILRLDADHVSVLTGAGVLGIGLGDRVDLVGTPVFEPDSGWIGRIIDADGKPLDGRPLQSGDTDYPHQAPPLAATQRRGLGQRLETGLRLFNTMLPLVRGQRVGLFAGSGIGKSTLIGQFAQRIETDVVVIALVGERGREVREFVEEILGQDGMARSVVVVATSDRSPLEKRRAAWAAMAVAEFFRDQGKQVLLILDSITRFAEAHREIALAAGEPASMRGFPPSIIQAVMSLCERAGPGGATAGDITAVLSVLVAGSDMDEPIADIVRGVLDGHIVLDRRIAERGRYPAVDVLRSVSRSLPKAASGDENRSILDARAVLGEYDSAELMIQSGLYEGGSDPRIDRAIAVWPGLDRFFSEAEEGLIESSFKELDAVLAAKAEPPSEDQ
jgi:flagellum-specific ATP synthase